tara:strand:- start:4060 stop:5634 length:1575 start_codon:yes stop_codon:yes gene_type:complete
MSKSNSIITNEIATLIGIDEDVAKFLQVKDTVKLTAGYVLILIRALPTHRFDWIENLKEKDPVLAGSLESISKLKYESFPTDVFDSGVIYLINLEKKSSKIVCRSDDFPQLIEADPTMIGQFFDENQPGHQFRDNLRVWVEGTVIRVFTFEIDEDNTLHQYTFFSTRSRIDSSASQWEQGEGKPFIKNSFIEAAKFQSINLESLKEEDTCHVFILQDPFNQTFNEVEQPTLYHIRTYSCGESNCDEINQKVSGAKRLEKMTPDEIVEYVRLGGTAITMNPFKNIKIILEPIREKYEWMNEPVKTWYKLQGNPDQLNTFKKIVKNRPKVIIDALESKHEEKIKIMTEFIHERLLQKLKNKDQYKKKDSNRYLEQVIADVQKQFRSAKAAFDPKKAQKDAEKQSGKNNKGGKGKKQSQKKGKVQVWSRKDEIQAVELALKNFLKRNGLKFLELQKFIDREIKNVDSKKPVDTKKPKHPKKEKKIRPVYQPDVSEKIFMPQQFPDLPDVYAKQRWGDSDLPSDDKSI